MVANKKDRNGEMVIAFNGASLNSTSWTTAAATGALTYLGYEDARKFAKAYDLQALLLNVQNEGLRTVAHALAPIAYNDGPSGMTDEQLRSGEREVLNCLAETSQWDQLAAQLSNEYGRVLKEK